MNKKDLYVYPAIFDDSENEKNTFTVTFPDIPGVFTEGKGLAKAMAMARECLELALFNEDDVDERYPASDINQIKNENPGKLVNYVLADMLEAKRIVKPAWVKKNTRIPGVLAAKGEQAGINFSQLLIEALEDKLGKSDY
ncbi:type II toxin-antitoxin system HicB family antitoxin [Lactobacillus sp. ESL0703]|uniref:type II toxin-antitoxin system HicB family antitoxin n=1 Tax=Lactobacillus sp. ESL0703 TaxID=2983218 RepID=UPI0023F80A68|nr:type II toxin-antitoxin system HicB family antitoxin [Lactobacillus sp. ESL0703]MDF7669550.1 type II toxin-antitoxin system HicB family antitoxin [Lactobacillus sp. ESL0703]